MITQIYAYASYCFCIYKVDRGTENGKWCISFWSPDCCAGYLEVFRLGARCDKTLAAKDFIVLLAVLSERTLAAFAASFELVFLFLVI